MAALKESGSEAAMKRMRDKMANFKKQKRHDHSSSSAESKSISPNKSTANSEYMYGESKERPRAVPRRAKSSHDVVVPRSNIRRQHLSSRRVSSLSDDKGESKEKRRGLRRQTSSSRGISFSSSSSETKHHSNRVKSARSGGAPLRRTKSLSSQSTREALIADAKKMASEIKSGSSSNNNRTTPKGTPQKANYGRLSIGVQTMKDASMKEDTSKKEAK